MIWRPRITRPVDGAPVAHHGSPTPADALPTWKDVAWAIILEGPLPSLGNARAGHGMAIPKPASPIATPPATNAAPAMSLEMVVNWVAEADGAPAATSGPASLAIAESQLPPQSNVLDKPESATATTGPPEVAAAQLSEDKPPSSPRVTIGTGAGDNAIFHTQPGNIAPSVHLNASRGVDNNNGDHFATSFSGRSKHFTQRVFKKAASPLLSPPSEKSPSFKMPLRSRRIAAQPLSKVPVAMRGEFLDMQRMGLLQGRTTTEEATHELDAGTPNLVTSSRCGSSSLTLHGHAIPQATRRPHLSATTDQWIEAGACKIGCLFSE